MLKDVVDAVTNIISPVYLVGGAVRDHVMGNDPKDWDFTTPYTPDEIEMYIRGNNPGRHIHLVGKRFGTIGTKVYIPAHGVYVDVEITTFREEVYHDRSRKPDVTFVGDITQDLMRRDFTFNAMAIRKKDGYHVIDPFGGQDDLNNGIIRAVGIPRQRFKEDPLRMLRAAVFASRFGWKVDEQTMKHMTSGSVQILNVSKERWVSEIDKLLLGEHVAYGLNLLADSQLIRWMLPELHLQIGYDQSTPHHDFSLWEHTVKVVEACPKDVNLRWAALLHDVGKPFAMTQKPSGQQNYVAHELIGAELAKKIGVYLKWSKDRQDYVVETIAGHLADDSVLKPYDSGAQKRSGT
jgi:tRNA nucleotidyltransferase (CCA-adding enzyme)